MTPPFSSERAASLFASSLDQHRRQTNTQFLYLLLVQWAFAIVVALVVSPYAWEGKIRNVHQHVWVAIVLGGIINALPFALVHLRPGAALTRHVVTVAQMLWSALFVHLTGGRIETHFHVFASLAFVAFYRDWQLLVTATLVTAADHLIRGFVSPVSVYGITNPVWWRFLEHAAWVVFEDIVLVHSCLNGLSDRRAVAEREASLHNINSRIEREVTDKTAALQGSMERFRVLVESTQVVPWEIECESFSLSYIAPQVERMLGYRSEYLVEQNPCHLVHPDDRERVEVAVRRLAAQESGAGLDLEYRVVARSQRAFDVRSVVSVHERHPGVRVLRGITINMTLQKKLELELQQSQKLESVGRLAAGVAHEINTPVQFVSDSVHFVQDAIRDLRLVVDKYRIVQQSVLEGAPSLEAAESATEAEIHADLDYVLDNVPKALERSLDGLERVAVIVRSMKEFAHPDQKDMTNVDLNKAIESTLVIAGNEYKYVADAETHFGDLPLVRCFGGDINQALLNIIVNAAHAIADVVKGTDTKGLITVQTHREGDAAIIRISDTGGGIPAAIRERVFDPFFTTKEVGKGTGQGLAIARSVVVDKHRGRLTFETAPGSGTTFVISLPIQGCDATSEGVAA